MLAALLGLAAELASPQCERSFPHPTPPLTVSFSCSSRDDRCEARAAFDIAQYVTTCGLCCSEAPLSKTIYQHQLINPHLPVGLRGDSVHCAVTPSSRESKALELGKPWNSAVLFCACTPGTCKGSVLHTCLQGSFSAMQRAERSATLETGLELPSSCSAGSVFTTRWVFPFDLFCPVPPSL